MNVLTRICVAILAAFILGWGALVAGGHTDAAGRTGLALGLSTLALILVGWGTDRRRWGVAIACAAIVAVLMSVHYMTRG